MLLVTAPTGNVGGEVAKYCVENDPMPYRLAAHTPSKLTKLYGDDIPVVKFSYADRSTWDAALEDVDRVFLVFPLPQPRNVDRWMKPFIDELVKREVKHIVYLDVPGADKHKIVPHYGVERYLEQCGVPYTFLRCTYFMQNLCRGISTHGVDIMDHNELFVPASDGRMTVIDARDVAEVAIKIMQNPDPHRNCAYTLAGPENINMEETAEILADVLEKPIRYTNPNPVHFAYRMWRRGVKWDVILFMSIVYRLTRQGSNAQTSDELEMLLGRPAKNMRQFVEEEKWRWETCTWT